jgi:thioredoxin reductase/SAM-dependent methyltransferase
MNEEQWDVVIAGGGAAGLSAALMLGRARRRVLVVDRGLPRNRFAAHMHGVLGHDGLDPAELLARGRAEVASYGVQFSTGVVERVEVTDDGVVVFDDAGSTLHARALVVATGLRDELLEIPGLQPRWGKSVLHCPYCHGWEVRGRRLGVLAASPLAVHQVELVRQWSDEVVFFAAGVGELDPQTQRRLRARGVEIVSEPVVEVLGEDDLIEAVRLRNGDVVKVDALFTAAAPRPHDGLVAHLGLKRADGPMGSFLAVDATGRTSNDRIWAVGNVVVPSATVAMAMGAGATTGGAVNMALVAAEFDAALAADAARFWEERYAGVEQVWSGRANRAVVDVVSELEAGRVLDLGCGEGGDAIWLAQQGWEVTGVDISPTAIGRARAAATAAGIPDGRITWRAHDLASWRDHGPYDLVTASFLQSPVELPRTEILRRAAAFVAPGGHLLIVSHAAAPPWAKHHHEHHFPSPQEELETLGIVGDQWEVRIAEVRSRDAVGPEGQHGQLDDVVVLLRRR